MQPVRIVTVPIHRAYEDAYVFMSDPLGMPQWSSIPDGSLRQIGPDEYSAQMITGPGRIRMTPRNEYGVLDYWVTLDGASTTRYVPLRLIRNDEGCELIITLFRGEGMSDETFNSEVEWITSEFLVLKTFLENR